MHKFSFLFTENELMTAKTCTSTLYCGPNINEDNFAEELNKVLSYGASFGGIDCEQ